MKALLLAGLLGAAQAGELRLNQIGFPPGAAKWAVAEGVKAGAFAVFRNGKAVLKGRLDKNGLADFSSLREAGDYELRVAGLAPAGFRIAADAYAPLSAAALKAFYFNRSGTALLAEHAGPWARAAGHVDAEAIVHASAASKSRPAGAKVHSPKGWYDAGDYNLYVVNAGITTYTLLAAYEHYPAFFKAQALNIPESGNALPDVLDELRWNLDWLLSMQDPEDGSVAHKLTNQRFDGVVMPEQAKEARYLVGRGTAATLNFAAVMASASRVFKQHDPERSKRMLSAAEAAWRWAQANPALIFKQPADIHTGGYEDNKLDDEFAWAAAELYIGTGAPAYWQAFAAKAQPAGVPGWAEVGQLAWISLLQHRDRLGPEADRRLIEVRSLEFAEQLTQRWKTSPWRTGLREQDFGWGSSGQALNQALVLIQGFRLSGKREQLDAAQALLDHVLGRNALGLSFVTGIGQRSPQHPHHRPSEADGVAAPVPGFVVGGPNGGLNDKAHCPPYPSTAPAKAYIDHFCSWASNEVAINWNAPLVYVSTALQVLSR